jgi:hypothetical protein
MVVRCCFECVMPLLGHIITQSNNRTSVTITKAQCVAVETTWAMTEFGFGENHGTLHQPLREENLNPNPYS